MLGLRPSAISNYVRRGQIYGPALSSDGGIVVEIAKAQLGVMVDWVRSEGQRYRIG